MLKAADLEEGMKLVAVGDYADCIKKGDRFTVARAPDGELCIACRKANWHTFDDGNFVTDDGTIPELELVLE